MKCSNCGIDLPENINFCSNCGAQVSAPVQTPEHVENIVTPEDTDLEKTVAYDYGSQGGVPQMNFAQSEQVTPSEPQPVQPLQHAAPVNPQYTQYVQPGATYNPHANQSKKKPLWPKVLLIVLIVLVIAAAAFAYIYFGTDLITGAEYEDENTCRICDDEIDEDEDYCDDCLDEYTCKECDDVDEDVKDGYCEDCAKANAQCKECGGEPEEDGYYCADCIEYLCDSMAYECAVCWDDLKQRQIYYIDEEGQCYCKKCDTGNYCEECKGVIEKDDDDTICFDCAEYWCTSCGEVIDESEAAVEDDYGNLYCDDCDTGNYCEDCDGVLEDDDDDYICYSCADYYCESCYEVIDEDEIAVEDDEGYVYCEDCDTGEYCDDCGAPVEEGEEYCYMCE